MRRAIISLGILVALFFAGKVQATAADLEATMKNNQRYPLTFLATLLCSVLITGCATIISGRHQEVQVISSPSGAKACTEGQCVTTPGTFTLRRDSNHAVVVEKEGYLSETVILTSGMGGAIAGNIILGGLVGGGIDMASGAAYKLYPETVNVALRAAPKEEAEAKVNPKTQAPTETLSTHQPPQQKPELVIHYATLKLIKGPVVTIPPQTMRAEFMSGEDGHGAARVLYLGNSPLDGEYRTMAKGQSFAGLVKASLIDPDQPIQMPNASSHGFASFVGSDGTLLECVYAVTEPTGNGLGNCVDNRGNQYQLSF